MKNVKCPYCKKKGGLMFIETPETLPNATLIGENVNSNLLLKGESI